MYSLFFWLLLGCPLLLSAQAKLGAVVLEKPQLLPSRGGLKSGKVEKSKPHSTIHSDGERNHESFFRDSLNSSRRKGEGFCMLRTEALGVSLRTGYGYRLMPWLRLSGGLGVGYAYAFSSGGNRISSSLNALYDPAIEVPVFFRLHGMAERGVLRPYYFVEVGYTYRYLTARQEKWVTPVFQQAIKRYSLGAVSGTIGFGSLFYQRRRVGLSAGFHLSYQAAWNVAETNRGFFIPGQPLLSTTSGFSHLWQPGIGLQLHF